MFNRANRRGIGSPKASRRRSLIDRAAMEALEQRALFTATPAVGIAAVDAAAAEIGANTGKLRLTRDDTTGALDVNLTITGTADNGVDYNTIADTVSFADGVATADITVTPKDDSIYEGPETVTIAVADSDDDSYTVDSGNPSATVTIADNEKPTISLVASDATATENDNTATGTFTISRDGPTVGALPVTVVITGTATNGTDYNTITTTATIADGDDSVDVTVTPKDDSLLEGTETVIMTVATNAAYNVSTNEKTATVNIADDEKSTVKIIATDLTATEGSATDTGKFTITRTGSGTAIADALTVHFTVGGTGADGTDWTTIGTSAVIPATKTSVDVIIKTTQDTSVEGTETAIVTLATNSAYTIDSDNHVATVSVNDDDKPTVGVSASDATANEVGPANSGSFTLTRTGATTSPLTVPIVITGTATNGTDYKTIAATVTIPAGKSSKVIEVRPLDDATLEGPETVIVTLGTSTVSIADGSNKTATVTINEDEVPDVTIAATDPNASEPGKDTGTFTVSRDGPTTTALTVTFAVTGTAISGDDYTDIGTTVSIPVGKSSATVVVTPKDDSTLEGPETVIVTLTDEATYDTDDDTDSDMVNIADNELPVVTLAATDPSAAEASTATGTFTLTRTGPTTSDLLVKYTISGTATNGTDYATITNTATIAAGHATKTITVTPVDDSTLEVDETVILTMATGTGYTVGTDKTGTVTIAENDKPTVTLVGTDLSASEPGTDKATITFTRNGPTTNALTVNYAVDDSSTATSGDDYTALTGTATILAGQTSVAVSIVPKDDTTLEGPETVVIHTSTDSAYIVDSDHHAATVTIADNEKPEISLTSSDTSMTEGDVDDSTASLTFTRTGPTNGSIDVLYTVSGFATPGTDTTEVLSGTVTIADGAANKTITLHAVDDSAVEGPETIIATLKAGTAYTISSTDKAATITINDNDKPVVSIAATDATGKENSKDGVALTVTRTGATRQSLDVSLTASGVAGQADFTTTLPSTVTIPAGKSFVTFTLATANDSVYEGTETMNTLIVPGDGYNVDGDNGQATVSIADDELPTIGIAATDASASETGPATGTFTITRKDGDPTTDAITVNLLLSGTAKNGKDYNKISKTVTIAAGDESATVTVTPKSDSKVEGPETVIATLDKGNYLVTDGHASDTVTIADAQKPTISIEALDTPIAENGSDLARFRIWRTGQTTGQTLLVQFDLAGTATVVDDYTIADENGNALTDHVTIPAGQASVDIYVTPINNDVASGDQTAKLTLASDSAYTVDSDNDHATVTITDDD